MFFSHHLTIVTGKGGGSTSEVEAVESKSIIQEYIGKESSLVISEMRDHVAINARNEGPSFTIVGVEKTNSFCEVRQITTPTTLSDRNAATPTNIIEGSAPFANEHSPDFNPTSYDSLHIEDEIA